MLRTRSILLAAAAALTGAMMTASSVAAAPDTDAVRMTKAQSSQLQARIDHQLAISKSRGVQISQNEIAWKDGKVVMTFPWPEGVVGPQDSSDCESLWTCLYESAGFNRPPNPDGRKLRFTDCVFEELANYGFQDKASSWQNNQTDGTITRVYNWNGQWDQLWESRAKSSSAWVGDGANDKADGMRVC